MAANIEGIVRSYTVSARNSPKYRRKRQIQLFTARVSLKLVPMNVVGPFLNAVKGRRFVLVTTNRYC